MIASALVRPVLWLLLMSAGAGFGRGAERVGAIGRIQPAGDVVPLFGPEGDAVLEVLVKEGDVVEAGAPLVRFAGEAAAQTNLEVARLALREADEGGRKAIALAELAVRAARDGLATAQTRLDRYLKLEQSSINPLEVEARRSAVEAAKLELDTVQVKLEQAVLTRETGVPRARADVARAESQLASTVLKAPFAGTVVSIWAVKGARTGGPMVHLADLREMVVFADVFEGDVLKIAPGARATISSGSLPAEQTGVVQTIGRQIAGQSKVARVRIRLDQPEPAARFLGMEVNVAIDRR